MWNIVNYFLPRLISMKQSKSGILINLPKRVIFVYTLRTISSPAGLLFGPKVVALPLIPYSYAFLFAGVVLLNHGNMLLLVHFHREAFRKIPNLEFSCRSGGLESFDYIDYIDFCHAPWKFLRQIFIWFTFAHFVFYDLTWSSRLDSNKKRTDFCIHFYILHLLRYSPVTNSISGVLQLTKLILFLPPAN